jgi:hypothetical protein
MNEGAFQAPFDSCFHAGQSSDQLPSGGNESGQGVTGILEGLFDRFRLGDELGVKGRGHNVPAFRCLLKGENDLAVAYGVLLHQDYGIRPWSSPSTVGQKPVATSAR